LRSARIEKILESFAAELYSAEAKHPEWPDDIVHQAAILSEESGECVQACLQFYYDQGNIERVKHEAIQTAAMCLRMLLNLEDAS